MPTKIEWAEESWNPVTGCTKVSPGCKHCYAEGIAERFRGGKAFPNGFDLTLQPQRLDQPSRWKKPRRIFVNSMSDLFHEDIGANYIWHVYRSMLAAPQHEYLVLTKRAERMSLVVRHLGPRAEPTANIWHGVSVENQRYAAERIPHLLTVPCDIHFLSCEPLLGPLDLTPWLADLQWVIVGGESGPKRRPVDVDWMREIRDQCAAAGVALFVKQIDKRVPIPDDLMIREYPTAATTNSATGRYRGNAKRPSEV